MISKTFFKLSAIASAMACILVFANSCDTLDSFDDFQKPENSKDKALYVFTVHEIVKYPRAKSWK